MDASREAKYIDLAKKEINKLVEISDLIQPVKDVLNNLLAFLVKINTNKLTIPILANNIHFIISHLAAIKHFLNLQHGKKNVHLLPIRNIIKPLIKTGRELQNNKSKPSDSSPPAKSTTPQLTPYTDNPATEKKLAENQVYLQTIAPLFQLFLRKLWNYSINGSHASKTIFISYAWPLSPDATNYQLYIAPTKRSIKLDEIVGNALVMVGHKNVRQVYFICDGEYVTTAAENDEETKVEVSLTEEEQVKLKPGATMAIVNPDHNTVTLRIRVEVIGKAKQDLEAFNMANKLDEAWTKNFVNLLATNLNAVGLKVYLDEHNSGPGYPLNKFMQSKIDSADTVLDISTRTKGYKLQRINSGVSYERAQINRRLANEPGLRAPNQRFIIPVLLNNTYHGPSEFREYAEVGFNEVVRFDEGNYLKGFMSLIKSIYGISKHPHSEVNRLYDEFIEQQSVFEIHENFKRYGQIILEKHILHQKISDSTLDFELIGFLLAIYKHSGRIIERFHGYTILHLAAKHDHTSLFQFLWENFPELRSCPTKLDDGADKSEEPHYHDGQQAIHIAARHGATNTLLFILQQDEQSLQATDRNNTTAFYYAMVCGQVECAKLLIDYLFKHYDIHQLLIMLPLKSNIREVIDSYIRSHSYFDNISRKLAEQPPAPRNDQVKQFYELYSTQSQAIRNYLKNNGKKHEFICFNAAIKAARNNDAQLVRFLLSIFAVDIEKNEEGLTATHWAVIRDSIDALKVICEQYPEEVLRLPEKIFALGILERPPSFLSSNTLQALQALIPTNVERTANNETVLHLAARHNATRALEYLLSEFVEKNKKLRGNEVNSKNETAMTIAIASSNLPAITLIARHPLCIQGALIHAAKKKCPLPIFEILLANGNRREADTLGYSVLHWLALNDDNLEVLNYFAKTYPDDFQHLLKVITTNGNTPLFCAVHHQAWRMLINFMNLRIRSFEFDVGGFDQRGWTILHYAAAFDWGDPLTCIMRVWPEGLSVRTTDHLQMTPLELAQFIGARISIIILNLPLPPIPLKTSKRPSEDTPATEKPPEKKFKPSSLANSHAFFAPMSEDEEIRRRQLLFGMTQQDVILTSMISNILFAISKQTGLHIDSDMGGEILLYITRVLNQQQIEALRKCYNEESSRESCAQAIANKMSAAVTNEDKISLQNLKKAITEYFEEQKNLASAWTCTLI